MVRYHPFLGACLLLVAFTLAVPAGPVYNAVPNGSSELAEQLAVETADQRLNKLVEAKLAKAKGDMQEAMSVHLATSSSKGNSSLAKRPTKPVMDKFYIPGAKSDMRDTGFIPSFGYGPLFPNSGNGPSPGSSSGSGMGGGGSGGNAFLGQEGSFSQVASLPSSSGGTSGSLPVSSGSGATSTGATNGTGSGNNNGQNGTTGQGGTPVQGGTSTNQGNSAGNLSNPNNPLGNVIGNSGGNGIPPQGSGNGDPGPVVIPAGSVPPIVPSIAAVPEPPAIALCLVGVAGIFFVVAIKRRTRR
jgi:hypothetical protein